MTDIKNNFYILKEYPNNQSTNISRLKNEVQALQILDVTGKVPKTINYDYNMNIAILEYIEGSQVNKVTDKNIFDTLVFVEDLFNLSRLDNFKSSLANEACLNANELTNQIEQRFLKLQQIENKSLQNTLKKLYELYLLLSQRAYDLWPKNNIDKNLNKKLLTFNPSDFGFHNTILKNNKELKFIDFEYFGLDDPVKLISDFLWHPGMQLSEVQKEIFTKNALNIFDKDKFIMKRLNSSFCLYGIRWALIILNDFLNNKMILLNKFSLIQSKSYEAHLKVQLDKSIEIYNNILADNMECKYVK